MQSTTKEKEKLFNYIRDVEFKTKEIAEYEFKIDQYKTDICNIKAKIINMINEIN